jgi:hypothetical protein
MRVHTSGLLLCAKTKGVFTLGVRDPNVKYINIILAI